MPANGMSCAAASAASGPSRVPMYTKRTSACASRSACATASTGVAEPPEPPPASRTRSSAGAVKRRLVLRAFLKALDSELDELGHELGEAQAAGLPQLREHADLGEARHGVDFVQVQPTAAA